MLRRRPIARAAVRTTAVVGTAAVVGGAMARRGQAQSAQQAPPPQPQQVMEVPAASVGPSPEAIEQLKELAGLKEQGILTEEEFAAEKAKILDAS
jgi:Short C-terminal domain